MSSLGCVCFRGLFTCVLSQLLTKRIHFVLEVPFSRHFKTFPFKSTLLVLDKLRLPIREEKVTLSLTLNCLHCCPYVEISCPYSGVYVDYI